jgi:hypothetical protein
MVYKFFRIIKIKLFDLLYTCFGFLLFELVVIENLKKLKGK